jgi:chemosensory pili system protein ChpA (sensor histidine kinase/response regulator)
VRQAFGLTDALPVDYALASLGQFDPAVLVQARKRIGAAKESWALFSGGDANRARQVVDQFGLIGDSLLKLHPASTALAQVLVKAVDQAARGQAGVMRPELSMEVATTTLYLEAAFEDFDPSDEEFTERTQALAARLESVLGGAPAEPLDAWMEQLYRRVSDRQTMGSVVGELKVSLGEAEKSLDQFFRMPREKACLHVAVSQLAQMRGVLSVLGLDQAVLAVSRMRTAVEQILDTEVDEAMAREAGTFQHLGDNLSALSFLVDMLNYQPALAKKLFVFDEETGELRPVMGRTVNPLSSAMTDEVQAISAGVQRVVEDAQGDVNLADLSQQLDTLADQAQLAEQTGVARAAREAAQAVVNHDAQAGAQALVGLSQVALPVSAAEPAPPAQDNDDEDLLDIFLEEAREVVVNGLEAVRQLQAHPGELEQLTTLRRAFHTLKGSSRMVGLTEYGEAAWAMEQLFNAVLAEQRPAAAGLLTLAKDAMETFDRWVDAIEARAADEWKAEPFIRSAQAWRDQTQYLPLAVASAVPESVTVQVEPEQEAAQTVTVVDWDQPEVVDEAPRDFAETSSAELDFSLEPEPSMKGVEVSSPMLSDIDFDSLALVSSKAQVPDAAEAAVEPDVRAELPAADVSSMFDDISLDLDDLSALDDAAPQAVETAAGFEGTGADATGTLEVPDQVDLDVFATPEAADVTIEVIDFEDVQAEQPEPAEDLRDTTDLALPEVTSEEATSDATAADEEPASPEATPEEEPGVDATVDDMPDDQTRLIGPLRIGIKLYNVYLNEADEWSRRLCTSLGEWSLERHEPVPDQAEALAHSLAGASATVGFQPLSDIARALEHALGAVALHQQGGVVATAEQSQLFVDAAEDIRRLLHQFAAGFFKEPNADLLAALDRLLHAPVPSTEEPDIELLSHWDAELPPDAAPAVESTVAPDEVPSAFAPPAFEATGFGDSATVIAPLDEVGSQGPVQDIDDDIDALDTIDVDLFPIFADEALELLPQLGAALRQWVARPENTSARAEVLRNLHTLKGSARLAGALRLGEMAHRMETEAERLGSEVQHSDEVEPLMASYDAIGARFELLRRIDPEAPDVVRHAPEQAAIEALSAPESVAQPVVPVVEPVDTADMPGLTGLELPSAPKAVQARAGAAVRVRPELLDRLVNQAGEVMISRSRMESELVTLRGSLKDLTGNLDRLRIQLRDIELQAETQMQSRLAQARDADQSFDPLEFDRFTRVQELTRMMAESVNDVATVQRNLQRAVEATEDGLVAQGRQTRELQRDLLRTRMVEFEGISERLYRVVRQTSKETGKQVRLDIVGGHIEMDRGILDRMTAAFEHLLRNCVVHGIESPEERLAAGKPAEGRIEVRLAHELNDVSLVFQDDGAGLDLVRLREKALAQGYVAAGTELSDEEAAQLVFMPGLTTASEVSSLAGRGVGMDVVRTDVVALGGRVETRTRPGRGTDFKLVLPLTTAVTQVVMVRAGSLTLGVPSNLVELVRRVSADELAQSYAKGTLTVAGEEVPFYWAGALLQSSVRTQEAQGRTLPVVIFRSAAQRMAMHVDEVLGNQEVVVKNLGPQLSRLPGLAGMSVLASGAVALIYNPVALATVYGPQVQEWVSNHTQQPVQAGAETPLPMDMAASAVPLVLVVDDSITVRRVTQRLLQREGYRVSLAADGLQALERLQQERPTVVLSDIEMPRMDGFDLVRNIRSDPRLAALPVIMITSRIAEKHREHARELGVDHYLGKPYAEDELLALIGHYAKAGIEA